MTVFLVIVSLYGGIATIPMGNEAACRAAADKFNSPMSRTSSAYCVNGALLPKDGT